MNMKTTVDLSEIKSSGYVQFLNMPDNILIEEDKLMDFINLITKSFSISGWSEENYKLKDFTWVAKPVSSNLLTDLKASRLLDKPLNQIIEEREKAKNGDS